MFGMWKIDGLPSAVLFRFVEVHHNNIILCNLQPKINFRFSVRMSHNYGTNKNDRKLTRKTPVGIFVLVWENQIKHV